MMTQYAKKGICSRADGEDLTMKQRCMIDEFCKANGLEYSEESQ